MKNKIKGFTLIELLVVVSILGILLSLSVFGMQAARQSSRDAKRKSDMEQIRSGLEMYKADCGSYKSGSSLGTKLTGDGSSTNCPATNVYISSVPLDPMNSSRIYSYVGCSDGSKYVICAGLENAVSSNIAVETCTDGSTIKCGSCGSGITCNYQVTNP